MRRSHFQIVRPVCPVCRSGLNADRPLQISRVIHEVDDSIIEGILQCPDLACQREFPILDGIPLMVGPIRQYVSDNVLQALTRTDLSPEMESLIGDCIGPGTAYDQRRQLLSAYAWDHYGEFDKGESNPEIVPGSIVRVLRQTLDAAGPTPPGLVVDLGCSVGRTAFELAAWKGEPVLGIDLNFSMIQLATRVLHTGRVSYPRRRVGIAYDRRDFSYHTEYSRQVDFWAADLMSLPLRPESVSLAVGLNVLDCVSAPLEFLHSVCRLLVPGGKLILTTPFDWSTTATPVEAWLGGHSQRTPFQGDSEQFLRKCFTESGPHRIPQMHLVDVQSSVPWQVRLHERAAVNYCMCLLVAEKECSDSEAKNS